MSTLDDASLFISDAAQPREVKLPDGRLHTVYFKELPASEFRRFYRAEASEDENIATSGVARLLAASLCEPDGKPALSFKKALMFKPAVANALFEQLLYVNGLKEKEKKELSPEASNTSGES